MGIDTKDILIVIVTTPTKEEAEKISDTVVRARQAACATIIPLVHSTYWWDGKVMNDQETMIFLKTTGGKFQSLQDTIKNIHTNQVPEIIAIPVTNGLPQYIDWVLNETS